MMEWIVVFAAGVIAAGLMYAIYDFNQHTSQKEHS